MKEDLKKNLAFVFEKNENAQKVYVAPDGHIFLEKAKNHAVNHANRLQGKLEVVTRAEITGEEEVSEENNLQEMTIAELKDFAIANSIEVTKTKKDDILAEIELELQEYSSSEGSENKSE